MKLKLAAVAVGFAFSIPAMADYGSVYQSGTDNYANIDQTSSGAGAYVQQIGDRNHVGYNDTYYGYQYPGITQYFVNSGWAQVLQQGNDNSAWVYQYYGDNQTINIQQGGGRWVGDTWVDYGAAQGNYASFNQNSYGGANQSIDVLQAGNWNSAYGWQNGSDNRMTVFQNGTSNVAYYLNQYGSGGSTNVMNVSQTGDSNVAGYYYYYYGVSQSGAGNQMDITQNGSYNAVYQATQYGNNNSLNISQTGMGHYAASTQYGNGNAAVITQH